MVERVPRWESELWSCVGRSTGKICPSYGQCNVRRQGNWCLCDNTKDLARINAFVDEDEITLSSRELDKWTFMECMKEGRIFKLIEKLADGYCRRAKIHFPPVSMDLISLADDNHPIEIHILPLKALHGAMWHLSDRWVIQLNSDDTPVRQRFTLFHEVFHILAHRNANPVFKKRRGRVGSFNETLAEHFAGCILIPRAWIEGKWAQCKDVHQVAEIFEVPKPVMWFALRATGLI